MSGNTYFNHLNPLTKHTLARAESLNMILQAIADGFAQLPDVTALTNGSWRYGESSGLVNAYTIRMNPTVTAYTTGMEVTFKPIITNTGPSTVNIDGVGIKSIRTQYGVDVVANDIAAHALVTLRYNGEHFIVTSGTYGSALAASAEAAAEATASAAFVADHLVKMVVASEELQAGDFVNIYLNGADPNARKAVATDVTRQARGFVRTSASALELVAVHLAGNNNACSGLQIGTLYFLSDTTAGRVSTVPPCASGHFMQRIGVALSATELPFTDSHIVVL